MKSKELKSTVLPYKLLKYTPRAESQVLVTTRTLKFIRLPYINKRNLHHSTASLDLVQLIDSIHHKVSSLSSLPTPVPTDKPPAPPIILPSPRLNIPKKPRIADYKASLVRTVITSDAEPRVSASQHFFWLTKRRTGHIPGARQNSQAVILADALYLYGGQSHIKHPEMRLYNLLTQDWRRLECESPPPGRLGHSMVLYKRSLLVYGGWINDKIKLTDIKCSKDLFSFDTTSYTWKKVRFNGAVPGGRRHHCAVVIGSDMIVYGGLNNHGERLKELLCLNLVDSQWSVPTVKFTADPGQRSHFSMSLVFHDNLLNEKELRFDELGSNKWVNLVKNSGVYLFGGLDATNQPSNDLFVLCAHNSSLKWVEVNAVGAYPNSRYGHTATVIKHCIFVVGGRNDMLGRNDLGDLHVFSVENLKWEQVVTQGSVPEGRWGHCACSYGSRVLILGGLNSRNFMNSDMYELETNPAYVDDYLNRNAQLDGQFI